MVTQFLWPTKKQEKEDEMLVMSIDCMDQNEDFDTKRKTPNKLQLDSINNEQQFMTGMSIG